MNKFQNPSVAAKAAKQAKSNKGAATAFAVIFAIVLAVVAVLAFLPSILDNFGDDMVASALKGISEIFVANPLVSYIVLAVLAVVVALCSAASVSNGKKVAAADAAAAEFAYAEIAKEEKAKASKRGRGVALLNFYGLSSDLYNLDK